MIPWHYLPHYLFWYQAFGCILFVRVILNVFADLLSALSNTASIIVSSFSPKK